MHSDPSTHPGHDPTDVESGSNLLVQPPRRDDGPPRCVDVTRRTPWTGRPVVLASYDDSSRALVDGWRASIGDLPDRFAIVDVGGGMGTASDGPTTVESDGVRISRVAADDLTGIGSAIVAHLSDWGAGAHPVVCFDSPSSLIRTVGFETALEFLQVLTGKIRAFDAVGYYVHDPEGADDRTVEILDHVFDAVLGAEALGEPVTETSGTNATFDQLRDEFKRESHRCPRCDHVDDDGNWHLAGGERDGAAMEYRRTCPNCGAVARRTVDL